MLCEANQNPQDYTYNCPEQSCHFQGKLGNLGANWLLMQTRTHVDHPKET